MTVETTPGTPDTGSGDAQPDPADRRGPLSTTRAALGLLRERRWIGALAAMVVLTIVFLFLGRWQLHRHEAKKALADLVAANYNATAVPLTDLIPVAQQSPTATLAADLEYRPVTVTGEYLAEDTILIRNRPHDQIGQAGTISTSTNSANGYEVVVPLRTDDGSILFVDRGWIEAGSSDAAEPDEIPQAPSGEITVVARLRPSEEASDRTAPTGQAMRINIPALTEQTGLTSERVVGAFGALVSEDPSAADTPEAADEPDTSLGVNLSYSMQWDSFALIAWGLFGVAMVREVRRRDEEDEDDGEGGSGGDGGNDQGKGGGGGAGGKKAAPVLTRATYR